MADAHIDAEEELAALRQRRGALRRRRYRRSRLERYRAELVQMRRAGASYPELATWLRRRYRVRVHHSTVLRYLTQLPEMQEDAAADA